MNMDDSTLIIANIIYVFVILLKMMSVCIFDKNLLYQHVPGQDSSPQLRGPDNTASGPTTARLLYGDTSTSVPQMKASIGYEFTYTYTLPILRI